MDAIAVGFSYIVYVSEYNSRSYGFPLSTSFSDESDSFYFSFRDRGKSSLDYINSKLI